MRPPVDPVHLEAPMRTSRLLLIGLLAAYLAGPAVADDMAAVKKKLSAVTLELKLTNTPLDEVVRTLATQGKVPVVVDPKVYATTPASQLRLTFKVPSITVWKALELIAEMTGLEMAVDQGVVRLQGRTGRVLSAVTKAYYIGDLMFQVRDFAGPRLGFQTAYPPQAPTGRELYGSPRPTMGIDDRPYFSMYSEQYVPLGTPAYTPTDHFRRPMYRDRHEEAPFRRPRPTGLLATLQDMSGGEKAWNREGVAMAVTRGGHLVVTHTPDVHKKLAEAMSQLRGR